MDLPGSEESWGLFFSRSLGKVRGRSRAEVENKEEKSEDYGLKVKSSLILGCGSRLITDKVVRQRNFQTIGKGRDKRLKNLGISILSPSLRFSLRWKAIEIFRAWLVLLMRNEQGYP